MSEYDMNGNVASENSAARERGASVAREYERVVNTFNKVLLFKEKIRLSVEHRIRISCGLFPEKFPKAAPTIR